MKKTFTLILFFIISCTASQEDSLKITANSNISFLILNKLKHLFYVLVFVQKERRKYIGLII